MFGSTMDSRSIIAVLLAGVLFTACGAPSADQPPAAAEDGTEAEEPFGDAQLELADGYANPDALVDTEWVLTHLDDPTVHIIDVSTQREGYEQGHLPGAQFVQWDTDLTDPLDPVEGKILSGDALSDLLSGLGVANDHTVVFYDGSNNLFAARAYWVLKYYRHEDVRVYNGGTQAWTAAGQELTTDAPSATPTTYAAGEPDPAIATDWDYVVSRVEDPSTMFCDVRTPDEHAGVDVRAERGGHIPGSVNIEWREAVREDGTFLDARTLAELYQRAGFTPDKEIITYCQSGVRGAHTWFVLSELLGYPNVRNYDGSWTEYGNRADSPI
jgi:thiosulfate/3-mercaptopyruvate sulfurtransferase